MYKLLMAFFLPYSFLYSNDFTNLSERDLFSEPSLCQKTYDNCLDECESKSTQTLFTSCLSDCSIAFEECEAKKGQGNQSLEDCKSIYKNCSNLCEKESVKLEE